MASPDWDISGLCLYQGAQSVSHLELDDWILIFIDDLLKSGILLGPGCRRVMRIERLAGNG